MNSDEVAEPAQVEPAYSLASSREGIGELTPVLKDAYGNIIDGFHRQGEVGSWREETLPWIDNPVKLGLAILAVNFNRRKVMPEELKQRLTFLVKAGLTPEEIATKTGISKTTIYKYMPQEAKNQIFSELGRRSAAARSIPPAERTGNLTPQDTEKHNLLVEALDAAAYPNCPECLEEPVHINGSLPVVKCAKGHSWSLKTGAISAPPAPAETSRQEFMECGGCHTNVRKESIVNGRCDVCREREKKKGTATKDVVVCASCGTPLEEPGSPAKDGKHYCMFCNPDDESEKPTREEGNPKPPTKPVDYEAKGNFCPVCGAGCSQKKYERLKKKFGTMCPDLFVHSDEDLAEKHTKDTPCRARDQM
jgi:hypothetical protein